VDAAAPAPATPTRGGRRRKKGPKARLVVVGTANLASNQFLGAQGNRDFLHERRFLAGRGRELDFGAGRRKSATIVLR
jgi:hypothetical protein